MRLSNTFSRFLAFTLVALGLLISTYLLYRLINISTDYNPDNIDVCSIVFGKGCDFALSSQMSTQFGLPLSAWGIIFYTAIILFLLMPFLFGKPLKQLSVFLVFSLCLVGLFIAIALLTTMIISPKLFCPFCVVIHTLNITLFFLLPRAVGFHRNSFFKALPGELKLLFKKQGFLSTNIWKVFGFLTCLFFLTSGYFVLRVLTAPAPENTSGFIDFKPVLKEYKAQPVKTIPIAADDASIGQPDSKIQVVVFSDFFCSGCKKFYYDLKNVIDSGKGKYHIVFKNFPLDKNCNPILKEEMHKGACEAASAAEAANIQGKFWAFHDALFTADKTADDASLKKTAVNIGLDIESFNSYRHSDSAKAKLNRDISLAVQLGIDATPTVFLNGRQVKDLRKGFLKLLINEEIQKSTFNIY